MFKRKTPEITQKELAGLSVCRDAEINIVSICFRLSSFTLEHAPQNTQSGSQWDGMKHFGIFDGMVYYNGYDLWHQTLRLH